MFTDSLPDIPPAGWCIITALLVTWSAQGKVTYDLWLAGALPKVRWWQRRSFGHYLEMAQTHRRLFPESHCRLVWCLGLAAFIVAVVLMIAMSNSTEPKTT
jgi:hypothetical protein